MRPALPARPRLRSARRVLPLALLVLVLAPGPPAGAHTAFESSEPAEGETVDHPIDRITVVFTGEAEPAGDGFVVLTPQGDVVRPEVVRQDDGRTFTLDFDPPLVDGEVGVRWSVRAGDAHPIEGSFRVSTTAPPPTAPPLPTTQPTAAPTPAPTAPPEPATTEPESADTPTAAPEPTTAPALDASASLSPSPTPSPGPSVPPRPTPIAVDDVSAPMSMDDFMNLDDGFDAGRPFGWVGRWLSVTGAILGIGLFAFARLDPAVVATRSVAVAAAMLGAGAVAEAAGPVVGQSGADALWSQSGAAIALRLCAAAAIAAGVTLARDTRVRTTALAVGAGAALASWLFDGHTVTEGSRVVASIATLAHVGAAAVWFGGIVGLLQVHRSDRERFTPLVVRFSVVAAVALAVAGVAGIVLAIGVLDTASDVEGVSRTISSML